MDAKIARVVEAGAAIGLHIQPVTFTRETRTAVDASKEVGCELGQIVKSLIFLGDNEPVLCLVSGADRLDEAKARAAAEVRSLRRADAEMAKQATGYSIGSTPPFGHATSLRVFMDVGLLAFDEVWAAAGRPDSVFPIDPRELAAATHASVCPLALRTRIGKSEGSN
jgi:prolyl-tRNA editing enzyme YbaK/EbsC (Cys-tRNA(Pro) deacylase)